MRGLRGAVHPVDPGTVSPAVAAVFRAYLQHQFCSGRGPEDALRGVAYATVTATLSRESIKFNPEFTMKIKVLEEKFLDGRDTYLKDEIRTVEDERGRRFVENGWAEDLDGVVKTGDRDKSQGRDLDIQKSTLGGPDNGGGWAPAQ